MVQTELVSKQELISGVFLLKLKSACISENARPGCFIMVKPGGETDPLLRRPFAVAGISGQLIDVLLQVKGRGTELISTWRPGKTVDVLGPLGNGFPVPGDLDQAYLIGGGMGAAPLVFLAKTLKSKGVPIKMFYGAKTVSELISLEAFGIGSSDLYYCTEDGTKGDHGLVTETLDTVLKNDQKNGFGRSMIYCCGPANMSEAVSGIALSYALPCQVSLEEKMACGVGACLGCVTQTKGNIYKRVCVDGPVFKSTDVFWKISNDI